MTSLFQLGQLVNTRVTQYTITKQLSETIWLARSQLEKNVVVKAVKGHFRVESEQDILRRFQSRSLHLRPLADEILDPPEPPTSILRHLEDNLLRASIRQTLNRTEIKYVTKRILEAIRVLHVDEFVHSDVKPDNIMVDYCPDNAANRFADVPACGFWKHPTTRTRSMPGKELPSALRFGEALKLYLSSLGIQPLMFGHLELYLIYGGDFNLFDPPDVPYGHEEYEFHVLKRQFQFFGPFPPQYHEIVDTSDTIEVVLWLMESFRLDQMKYFRHISEKEVCREDKKLHMLDYEARSSKAADGTADITTRVVP